MSKAISASARILIIDDDLTTLETFRYMLSANGYAVLSAPTIAAGLDHISSASSSAALNAILLDFHMPLGDGLESLRRLREVQHCRQIPAAIITGDYFLEEHVARELNQLGAHIHFKPLWEDDIVRLVQSLVGRGQFTASGCDDSVPSCACSSQLVSDRDNNEAVCIWTKRFGS